MTEKKEYNLTTREGRNQFVSETWPELAYIGYEGYVTHGRGAVVIPGSKRGASTPFYAPLDANFGSAPANHYTKQYIREYDPEKEIVCVFFLGPGRSATECYQTFRPEHIPPKIYLASSGKRRTND